MILHDSPIQAGVNLNAPLDSNHMTALMIACMMGNWDPRCDRRWGW